ncbi:MAG: hypothetical protein ACM3ZR_08135 [Pseudomonadota bacterium]
MPTDFELAEGEKVASVVYIIGAVLAIITSDKAESELIQQQIGGGAPSGTQTDTAPLTVSQLVVIISLLYVIGNTIFGQISFFRLEKTERDIAAGTGTGSAIPNKLIAFGWLLGIVGSLIRLVGAQLRVEEEKPITIL